MFKSKNRIFRGLPGGLLNNLSGTLLTAILTGLTAVFLLAPFTTHAGLCEDLAKKYTFIKCGSQETSFVDYKGGLAVPTKEGYAPELTQASSAREFILQITSFVLGFLGLAAVLAIIYSGFLYVTAGGADEQTGKAKKGIMYSAVGLIVVMSSWAIVRTVIQAPTGSEGGIGGTGVVSEGSTAGGEAETAGPTASSFRVAANRVQILSRDLITAYENFVQSQEAFQNFINVSIATKFNNTSELQSFLITKKSILENIEATSKSLGDLGEVARKQRQKLEQHIALIDTLSEADRNKPEKFFPFSRRDITDLEDALYADFRESIKEIRKNLTELAVSFGGETVQNQEGLEDLTDNFYKNNTIGVKFNMAFLNIQQVGTTPDNSIVRSAIESLSDLFSSIENIQFVYAYITATPSTGNAPLVVNFDALKSADPNGETIDNARFKWNFGDGITAGTNGPVQQHLYLEPGAYRVKLAIDSTDKNTLPGFDTVTITVRPPSSYINLTYSLVDTAETYDISKWTDSKEHETSRNVIAVTLSEAQNGITFDATESMDSTFKNKITKFNWEFGDQTIFVESEKEVSGKVTHKYAKAGRYPLTLTVEDASGVIDRYIVNVIVSNIVARVVTNPAKQGYAGQEFTFDAGGSTSSSGQITKYNWTVDGESIPGNKSQISHTFEKSGSFEVKVVVEDNIGTETADETVNIKIISQPPIPQFSFKTPRANQPNIVNFDASRSYDPDGAGLNQQSKKDLRYKWEVQGEKGSYEFLSAATDTDPEGFSLDYTHPIIKFKQKGDFVVSLQVKDSVGTVSETPFERTITIDKILAVDWDRDMKTTSHLKDGKATIKLAAQSENAIAYEIRYGDAMEDTGEVPGSGAISASHVYTEAKEYEVTLIVFDRDNDETVISRKVFIGKGDEPVAVIRLSINDEVAPEFTTTKNPLVGNRKDTIKFDASESINIDGTGRRLDYAWDFGDGNRSTKSDVQRVYKEISPSVGYYTVRLTVTDKDTSKPNTTTAYVSIKPEPPEFLGMTAVPQEKELVTPTPVKVTVAGAEDPDGEIVQYRWWYYDVKDPDKELGIQITTSPTTTINIGTKGREGEEITYKFGAEVTDNENYRFSSDELRDRAAIPQIKVTNGPNKPPIAKFTVDRSNILVGEAINFTSASSDPDGKIIEYIWDFEGDGFHNNRPTKESSISYVFKKTARNGLPVKLKVVDNNYAEAVSDPVIIYVDSNSKPPTAAFTSQQNPNDLTVKFTNNSRSDKESPKVKLAAFIWDFDISSTLDTADSDGDGLKDNDVDSTLKDPVFTYKQPGIYRVKLTVEDTDGNLDEVINFVNVKDVSPYKAAFPTPVTTATTPPATTSSTTPATATTPSPKPATTPPTTPAPTPKPTPATPPAPSTPVTPVKHQAPEARLLTTPPSAPDGRIHLQGDEATVTFDFSQSIGNIVEFSIDKNIYYDTNGNGIKDDDKDYKTNFPGTWKTGFSRDWGQIRVRLTVIDRFGQKDTVEKDIVFDPKPTRTSGPSLLGPGGKITGTLGDNLFRSMHDISGIWLIIGTICAILGLAFFRLSRSDKE